MTVETVKKIGLFDFVEALSKSKVDLISEDPEQEKSYNPFMVNQAFSQHIDSVLYANEMNIRPQLSKRMQHDFYLHGVPSRTRRGKWPKRQKHDDVDLLAKFLSCSSAKAAEVLPLLTDADLERVRRSADVGGK